MRAAASLALAALLLAAGVAGVATTAAQPAAADRKAAAAPKKAAAASKKPATAPKKQAGTPPKKPAASGTATKPAARPAAKPAAKAAPQAPAQQRRQLQTEQAQLKTRLSQARRQLATAEASHSEATDALRASEAAISTAGRHLRELAADRRQVERQLAALRERSREAGARQSLEERQLGQVLAAGVAVAQQPAWQPLLAGGSPQQPGQDLAYLGYAARAGAQTIGELRERREELALLEAETRDKQAELARIAAAEETSRRQLLQQQAVRRKTLDRLARQIGSQRQSIATLERDEKRLSTLIDELSRVLAEQARRERERQAAAKKADRSAPGASAARRGTPATPADVAPPADSRFAKLRGKLTLPVQGEVTARFGAARRTEAGVDAPTWKGIFIRAAEGSDVRAVAAGRVVFADWLRGFGNLLIVDHGEGFLSVYGNNQSLFAATGERVDAGAVIASVGNSGGNPDAGLYFEMRFQGRPFDPLRWTAAR